GKPGDLLYVRETWTKTQHGKVVFKADATDSDGIRWGSITPGDPNGEVIWKPSIHMPKKASRIWLKVNDVRVERVQEITWGDAVAEGCPGYRATQDEPTHQFQRLWDSINGKRE